MVVNNNQQSVARNRVLEHRAHLFQGQSRLPQGRARRIFLNREQLLIKELLIKKKSCMGIFSSSY